MSQLAVFPQTIHSTKHSITRRSSEYAELTNKHCFDVSGSWYDSEFCLIRLGTRVKLTNLLYLFSPLSEISAKRIVKHIRQRHWNCIHSRVRLKMLSNYLKRKTAWFVLKYFKHSVHHSELISKVSNAAPIFSFSLMKQSRSKQDSLRHRRFLAGKNRPTPVLHASFSERLMGTP